MHIIPSIFVSDKKTFQQQIKSLGKSVDMIQIDIADGNFVPSTTWPLDHADDVAQILPPFARAELHLMVSDPLHELKKWQRVEQIERILVHYESLPDLHDILPTLHAYGWEIGLVLNPETPISVLEPFLAEIKTVMFMGVTPGKQGQRFDQSILQKIKDFRAAGHAHTVEVDGGVNEETLPDLFEAGTDIVCPGSAIFGNRKRASTNLKHLKSVIHKLTKQTELV